MSEQPGENKINTNSDEEPISVSETINQRTEVEEDRPVRCGNFTFSGLCESLKNDRFDIHSVASISFGCFKNNIMGWDPESNQRIPPDTTCVELCVGMLGNVDPEKFPHYADDSFLLLGFSPDKKKPANFKALIFHEKNKQFFLALMNHLRIAAEPTSNPAMAAQIFPDLQTWLINVANPTNVVTQPSDPRSALKKRCKAKDFGSIPTKT